MAPKIYGVFENGLAYQYYPGVTLNPDSVLDMKIWPLVAQQMARMHKVELGKEVRTISFNITRDKTMLSYIHCSKSTDKKN